MTDPSDTAEVYSGKSLVFVYVRVPRATRPASRGGPPTTPLAPGRSACEDPSCLPWSKTRYCRLSLATIMRPCLLHTATGWRLNVPYLADVPHIHHRPAPSQHTLMVCRLIDANDRASRMSFQHYAVAGNSAYHRSAHVIARNCSLASNGFCAGNIRINVES